MLNLRPASKRPDQAGQPPSCLVLHMMRGVVLSRANWAVICMLNGSRQPRAFPGQVPHAHAEPAGGCRSPAQARCGVDGRGWLRVGVLVGGRRGGAPAPRVPVHGRPAPPGGAQSGAAGPHADPEASPNSLHPKLMRELVRAAGVACCTGCNQHSGRFVPNLRACTSQPAQVYDADGADVVPRHVVWRRTLVCSLGSVTSPH